MTPESEAPMQIDSNNAYEATPKWCGGCQSFRHPSEFYKKRVSADGLASRCKSCEKAYQKERREATPHKVRDGYLRKLYGISTEQYDKMRWDQNGFCAICGRKPNGGRVDRLYVDHDHTSGTVRGLLCHSCNIALGCFEDDTARLMQAIEYLKSY